MLASFAMFFSLLCGYYILRPIRDELGVVIGKEQLERLFLAAFFVMLLVVPVFGWLIRTFSRRKIVPLIYGFFVLNILVFWLGLGTTEAEQARPVVLSALKALGLAAADAQPSLPPASGVWDWNPLHHDPSWAEFFFVWISVYNLFTVSLFWSLMAELFRTDQGKRLFGFIAAGGTLGGICGPLLTALLVKTIGTGNLLLGSACLLTCAASLALVLRRLAGVNSSDSPASPNGGSQSLLDGAIKVLTSPFLFRIALYIFLANVIGTYFYLEQSRIVGEALPDRAERLAFFASRDLFVSLTTITLELFVTGRLMQRFGLLPPLTILPVSAGLGLMALLLFPGLQVIAAIMVIERALAYAISNPAVKVLWTTVSAGEKYKAQNFVDTVVYRGGDAASGWIFAGLAAVIGGSGTGVALAALPLVAAWLYTGQTLAREHRPAVPAATPA